MSGPATEYLFERRPGPPDREYGSRYYSAYALNSNIWLLVQDAPHIRGIWDQAWYFKHPVELLVSWVDWEAGGFEGEPQGWFRHIPSNRRRENGDPNQETVRP